MYKLSRPVNCETVLYVFTVSNNWLAASSKSVIWFEKVIAKYFICCHQQVTMKSANKKKSIYFFLLSEPHSHSFPGHQPEIDNSKLKAIYNSWETTSRSAYVDPRVRLSPTQTPQQSTS